MAKPEPHIPHSSKKSTTADHEIELTETRNGVLLAVYAQPGARRSGILGAYAGRLKVAVTEVAEKGQANSALIEVLAAAFNLKRAQVRMHSGETSRRKVLLIQGLSAVELRERIAAR